MLTWARKVILEKKNISQQVQFSIYVHEIWCSCLLCMLSNLSPQIWQICKIHAGTIVALVKQCMHRSGKSFACMHVGQIYNMGIMAYKTVVNERVRKIDWKVLLINVQQWIYRYTTGLKKHSLITQQLTSIVFLIYHLLHFFPNKIL